MLLYFFFSNNTPTIAIAITIAITPATMYIASESVVVEPKLIVLVVGANVVCASSTTACVSAYELPYELLPANVAVIC